MPEHRMICRTVVKDSRFLKLTKGAQALYFHLMLEADDDGFVLSPDAVARASLCKLMDLKELTEKKYIYLFPSNVALIRQWRRHNTMRKDRYRPSNLPERATVVLDKGVDYLISQEALNQNNQDFLTEGVPNYWDELYGDLDE